MFRNRSSTWVQLHPLLIVLLQANWTIELSTYSSSSISPRPRTKHVHGWKVEDDGTNNYRIRSVESNIKTSTFTCGWCILYNHVSMKVWNISHSRNFWLLIHRSERKSFDIQCQKEHHIYGIVNSILFEFRFGLIDGSLHMSRHAKNPS